MNYKRPLLAIGFVAASSCLFYSISSAQGQGSAKASSAVDFASYKADLQQRIKKCWSTPHVNEEFCTCTFDVTKDGRLVNLRSAHSSGLDSFDRSVLSAISKSEPFASLPTEALGAHVTATLEVNGNISNVNLEMQASSVVAPAIAVPVPTTNVQSAPAATPTTPVRSVDSGRRMIPSPADAANVVPSDPYLIGLERRVERHWHPDNASTGSACCAFVIGKMGDVAHVRLVKSSGNPSFDQAAVKAIDSSMPFKPVPQRLDTMSVKITFDKSDTAKKLSTTSE
jgi:TonB family protein